MDAYAAPLLVAVVAALLRDERVSSVLLPSAAAAASKPFATFDEFYPFYLQEHSETWTKRLHYLGTTLAMVLTLIRPAQALALACAAAIGYAVFPYFRSMSNGIPEFAVMLAVYLICCRMGRVSFARSVLPLFLAYGCAWLGHFFVEHNRPATFIYPSFSLLGDFRMFYDMLRGVIAL